MSAGLVCQPYQQQDLEEILKLFSISFGGRSLSDKYYLWRVLEHPLNKNFIDVIKNEQGKLISHYAVCPAYSFYKGEYFNAALSLITMTHPEYNGMGLFPKLAANLYNRIHLQDQVQMVYGFPNTNSHYSFTNKLEWNDVYLLPTLRKNITPNTLATSELIHESTVDKRFDELWNNVSASSNLFYPNARNSSFLNWRFVNRPDKKYNILTLKSDNFINAYVVVKEYVNGDARELDMVDVLFNSNIKPSDLLNQLILYAQQHNFNGINLWAPYNSLFYASCEKMGFVPKEPITYLGYRIFNKMRNFGELSLPKMWHITMCDSDVY